MQKNAVFYENTQKALVSSQQSAVSSQQSAVSSQQSAVSSHYTLCINSRVNYPTAYIFSNFWLNGGLFHFQITLLCKDAVYAAPKILGRWKAAFLYTNKF